ncbi:MAG TPA: LD-carboxypeptidase [Polyangiaceae bacterium]|nr:LD-carboxypeptidase [Polyangiaceae bacterium]
MTEFVMPRALQPGDEIVVIAPSSPFDRALFFRGVGWLAERYRVRLGRHVLERRGFLAGSDEGRLADLNEALREPGVRAIVAARGGHGAVRLMSRADWAAFERAPKWIVGYSDITLLHAEAWSVGVCSLHAENAAGLGRGSAAARQRWLSAIEQPTQERCFEGLESLHGGAARGPLVGGNLTLLFTAQACARLKIPLGAVLALEDVTEASYRVDRMLSALAIAGVFDSISGVVLGDFTDCSPGPHRVPVQSVLEEHFSRLGIPVLRGLSFGHGAHNEPLPFGLEAAIEHDSLRIGLNGSASLDARRRAGA